MAWVRFAALLALFFFAVEVIHSSTPIFRSVSRVAAMKTKSGKPDPKKISKSKKQYKIKAPTELDEDDDFVTGSRAMLPETTLSFTPILISDAPMAITPPQPDQTERTVYRPPLIS